MRVLILGGTGLISTAITRELLARGNTVTHLNRGRTAGRYGDVTTVHGDRGDVAALRNAWGDGHDAVIDMICFTPGDARVAIDAYAGLVPHYVMCSTVDVYTKPARYLPVDEAHERVPSPAFRYAHDKAACEEILLAAHDRGDLPVTLIRPAATYADAAVPSIGSFDLALERLRAGRPIVLHGDGGSRWAACHRDDVARAFVAALGNPATYGRAYNVTGDEALTFEAYWRAVADALRVSPDFVHIPTDLLSACAPAFAEWCAVNFRYDNVFDCSEAARDLGFACTVRWADGIARGLTERVPAPVDPVERATYQAIVDAWLRASDAMRADLEPRGL